MLKGDVHFLKLVKKIIDHLDTIDFRRIRYVFGGEIEDYFSKRFNHEKLLNDRVHVTGAPKVFDSNKGCLFLLCDTYKFDCLNQFVH
jgi:hypothetical protein